MPKAVPPAPRKTLLEWIDHDDGDTTDLSQPASRPPAEAFHARILGERRDPAAQREPLDPPPGLRLAPLG